MRCRISFGACKQIRIARLIIYTNTSNLFRISFSKAWILAQSGNSLAISVTVLVFVFDVLQDLKLEKLFRVSFS